MTLSSVGEALPSPSSARPRTIETEIPTEIATVQADIEDIEAFYNVKAAPLRIKRLRHYLQDKLASLRSVDFNDLNYDSQVDYLLLQSYIQRQL